MKISAVLNNYQSYNAYKKPVPIFGSGISHRLAKDTFTSVSKNSPKVNILELFAGKFGTCCEGSTPMRNFIKVFGKDKFEELSQTGQSTNKEGYAGSFLKTSADKPISTSWVHSCSVIYMFNKLKNTHFLYHVYHDVHLDELDFIIKKMMPEGFTKAALILGDSDWLQCQADYVPEVYSLINENNTNGTEIEVLHNSSICPEIVGYKGEVYEIENNGIKKQLAKGISTDDIEDYGQASFKIHDLSHQLFDMISYKDSISSLKKLKNEFKKEGYDAEVLSSLNKVIDERIEKLNKIKHCKTLKELKNIEKRESSRSFSETSFLTGDFTNALLMRRMSLYVQILKEGVKTFFKNINK